MTALHSRVGDWMTTSTGRRFWPLDPRAEDVAIEDIAHALAQQCRFAGHTKCHYSTAQHSWLVSMLLEKAPCEWPGAGPRCKDEELDGYEGHRCGHAQQNVLWGLLHDAAEAYCSDVVRPVKRGPDLAGYRKIERGIQRAICQAFGLAEKEPPAVKLADTLVLRTEQRDLVVLPADHKQTGTVLVKPIHPWDAAKAERVFLARFYELTGVTGEVTGVTGQVTAAGRPGGVA